MPSLPTFSAVDCQFLRRYEHRRIAVDRIPSEDQAFLRDIRARLQSLAQAAAAEYRGRLEMTDFAGTLYPNGQATSKLWAGIHPRVLGEQRSHKSSHLQLVVAIMPEGVEICFCRGSGRSPPSSPERTAATERQLLAVKTALAHLRIPLVAHVERTLRSDWFFRKQCLLPGPTRDFATFAQWLDYAASDAGAKASVSMFIGAHEIENDKIDVGAMFLEANRLFEPLFEAVYGADDMAKLWIPDKPTALMEPAEPARRDLGAITEEFAQGLREAHLLLGTNHDENVRAFVASLAAKGFVILTGLSGSGKTQLALRFGDWLGMDRVLVAPVRPDWTGAEALFGYEDVLQPLRDGARAWHVPDALEFLLRAANDPAHPYLLILDEMNLAHVERYFADFLSGMETGQPCLPNLERGEDGHFRLVRGTEPKLPMPKNLFVIGTVNIDETTYLFSPKVLDRANTIDFRVRTDDLQLEYHKPGPCPPGSGALVRGFLEVGTDERFQHEHPAPYQDEFVAGLRRVHRLLSEHHLEFGHRVFYEATRFAAMFARCGTTNPYAALDRQLMQKILPRLHGSRRKLEIAICALGAACIDLPADETAKPFDPLAGTSFPVRMPLAYEKIQRMLKALRLNQFTSFSE